MDDFCHDVQIEPKLQSLDGEIFSSNSTTTDDDARLDIKANGLWGSRFNRTFSDVKIFNPHAKSCPKTIKDAYKYHESIKRNKYEERIRETEHSSFNALVFACSGGPGPSASRVMCCGCSRISAEPIYHSLVLEFYAGLVLHWVRLTNDLAEIISRSAVLKDCNFNFL